MATTRLMRILFIELTDEEKETIEFNEEDSNQVITVDILKDAYPEIAEAINTDGYRYFMIY